MPCGERPHPDSNAGSEVDTLKGAGALWHLHWRSHHLRHVGVTMGQCVASLSRAHPQSDYAAAKQVTRLASLVLDVVADCGLSVDAGGRRLRSAPFSLSRKWATLEQFLTRGEGRLEGIDTFRRRLAIGAVLIAGGYGAWTNTAQK